MIPNRNSNNATNPVQRYYKWKGSKGVFVHYDKELGKEVENQLPFTFMYLAEMACVSGFSDEEQCGYFSNEISPYDVKEKEFNVRLEKGGRTIKKGYWSEIKGSVSGAKFTKSIYALGKIDDKYQIINIQLYGSGFGNYSEIKNKTNGALVVSKIIEGKKGSVVYYSPIFETKEISNEAEVEAQEAAKKVVEYLKSKLSTTANLDQEVVEPEKVNDFELNDLELQEFTEDDLPF